MSLRIAQGSDYEAKDWWRWWVWIEGPAAELDAIESVTYTLHPTFANPVRRLTDRATRFRLETAGWGTFTIYARVDRKDGTQLKLTHDLELLYPDGTPTTA